MSCSEVSSYPALAHTHIHIIWSHTNSHSIFPIPKQGPQATVTVLKHSWSSRESKSNQSTMSFVSMSRVYFFFLNGLICQTWYFCRSETPQLSPAHYDSGRTSVWLCQSLYNCVVKKKNANAVWITRQYVLAKAASMLLRQWPTVFNTALPAKGHFPFGCSALTLKPRKSCCCCLSRKHPSTVTNTQTRPPHTFPLINNSKVTSYEYKQALEI